VAKKDLPVAYSGAIDNSSRSPELVIEKYVEIAVMDLLAGNKIEKTETRAVGCSIKRQ
jgi:hypothetical protein